MRNWIIHFFDVFMRFRLPEFQEWERRKKFRIDSIGVSFSFFRDEKEKKWKVCINKILSKTSGVAAIFKSFNEMKVKPTRIRRFRRASGESNYRFAPFILATTTTAATSTENKEWRKKFSARSCARLNKLYPSINLRRGKSRDCAGTWNGNRSLDLGARLQLLILSLLLLLIDNAVFFFSPPSLRRLVSHWNSKRVIMRLQRAFEK